MSKQSKRHMGANIKSAEGVDAITVADDGKVGIGTDSPRTQVMISGLGQLTPNITDAGDQGGTLTLASTSSNFNAGGALLFAALNDNGTQLPQAAIKGVLTNGSLNGTGSLTFSTRGSTSATVLTERMRIDASGNFALGRTDTSSPAVDGPGFFHIASSTIPSAFAVVNTNGGHNTYHLYNQNATNNGYRFYVKVDGGIANFSGNNVNLSDERTKTDIKPAGNYLEKICAIPVRTFRYKDQGDDLEPTLGVIAQEVEKVAPELVNTTDGFGDTPEDGIPLKTIYTTDMQFALMKALQELKAELDETKAEGAALRAELEALKVK